MKRRRFLQSAAALGTAIASPFVRNLQARSEPVKASTWKVWVDAPCHQYARVQPVKQSTGMFLTIQSEPTSAVANLLPTKLLDESAPEYFCWEVFQCRRYDEDTPIALARNRSLVAAKSLMSSPLLDKDNTIHLSGSINYEITQRAIETIGRNTFGMITMDATLVWVMNPTMAVLHGAVIPGGDLRHPDCQIPPFLHGIPLVVEDAVWRGCYVIPDHNAFLLTQLTGESYSGPNFSTMTLFMLECGTAWLDHGRTKITDDFDCRVTAPVSGVYLRAV